MSIFGNCMHFCRVSAVAALLAAGCSTANQAGPESGTESTSVDSLALELQKLNSDLRLGASGVEVRTLHKYFERYGYFPSSDLSGDHEGWQPVVSQDPAFDDVFDERTQEAVLHLQYQAGIEQSGYVDAATRDALRLKRESVIDRIDALVANQVVEKFSFEGGPISSPTSITFRFENSVSLERRHAIRAALHTWINETNVGFTEVFNGGPATMIFKFEALGINGPYRAFSPVLGSDVSFDSSDVFTTSSSTPAGSFDMQTVALQAIGRALGLGLSSIADSVMHVTLTPGSQRRILTTDDKVAISALYDAWAHKPGKVRHIAVGVGATGIWAVGDNPAAGGLEIYKWNGSGWTPQNGVGGMRVAVSSSGPWIVQTGGQIKRLENGSWITKPGDAKDIAAFGGDVWAVGRLDSRVYKWNGSGWTQESDNGEADRIAVTNAGIPWVVQADGDIYERNSANPSIGNWVQRPGCGKDIGAHHHVWLIGCNAQSGNFGIALWNRQQALGDAPAKAEWKFVSGAALTVGVGPTGPWVANNVRDVFELTKTN